ncbi:MAG: T9SS type A sorting domain-containing protein [Bacteroidetes bacterium]|nr:T9SS type A sorting domain-containing protein [Bacteroidota bacterium]
MKKYFTLLIILVSFIGICQKANNWHFGNSAGLNFNTATPSALLNGQTIAPDNTSSISDAAGNLLFYTNGVTVWNKNNVSMPNGNGLIGHSSAGQCAVIVPIPCSPTKYVIFHVTEYSAPGNLNYTVVDMSLNNGLGDVVTTQKNISLGTGWTEKLCAYYNPLGNFYWVFSHKWNSDQFVGFKVDTASIATQSVVSSIGSVLSCGSYGGVHDAMGQLTISPNGNKIVNALTCQDKFEVFDLNINTGVLSNSLVVSGTGGNAWGAAFSPDSKKLYVDALFGQSVLQYDLSSNNQSSVNASQNILYTASSGGYNFGYMELGPDSLVYIAKPSSYSLTVINNPNTLGSGSNFSLAEPSLGTNTSSHGLSRIAYNIPSNNNGVPAITVSNSNAATILCVGQTATLTANGANTYTWNTSATGAVIAVSPSTTTSYTVTGSNGGCSSNAAITVSVSECTSISKTVYENKFIHVYPNPLIDNLTIELNDHFQNGNLEVTNVLGQVIFSDKLTSLNTLDLSFLTAGLYFLNIHNTNEQQVIRLIKN